MSRWKTGSVPSLQAMRAVADALGVTMLDVLRAAGVIESDGKHAPPEPTPPNIDAAIAHDPQLSELQRRTLRDILASLRAVESGRSTRRAGRARR